MTTQQRQPTKEELEYLRKTPTAFVRDSCTRLGIGAVATHGIVPLKPFGFGAPHVAGPALTVQLMPRRGAGLKTYNMYSEVIPSAKPGDVLVIAGNGANAWAAGENQINHSIQYGIQAWVTDLGMRDVAEIIHMGFPMMCKGATPLGGAFEAVAVNVPVYLAGAQIRAGDIVVADDDGVAVVPIETFDKVMTNVRSLADQEKEQERLIKTKGPMADLLALLAKKSKPV